MSLRDTILKANDLKLEKVTVPEWGCDVYLKQLSGDDQDTIELSRFNKDGSVNIKCVRARYAALVLCDQDGKAIFEEKDIPDLNKKSGAVLVRLLDQAAKMNQLDATEIEDIAKNS